MKQFFSTISQIFLLLAMLISLQGVSAAGGEMYTVRAETHPLAYGVVVPAYFHAAMNCYTDASMRSLQRLYTNEAVERGILRKEEADVLSGELPMLCTQPWRADVTLAEMFGVAEGTVLNQGLLDTVQQLYAGPDREPQLVRWVREARDCVGRLESTCVSAESQIYRLFMEEYDAYVAYLRSKTQFSPDETAQITAWQVSQKNAGKQTKDQWAVFPTTQEEEITSALQSVQTARVVVQEFMYAYPLYFEFQAIGQSLSDTGVELYRIQRAMTQLLLKLPAIIACS